MYLTIADFYKGRLTYSKYSTKSCIDDNKGRLTYSKYSTKSCI